MHWWQKQDKNISCTFIVLELAFMLFFWVFDVAYALKIVDCAVDFWIVFIKGQYGADVKSEIIERYMSFEIICDP